MFVFVTELHALECAVVTVVSGSMQSLIDAQDLVYVPRRFGIPAQKGRFTIHD